MTWCSTKNPTLVWQRYGHCYLGSRRREPCVNRLIKSWLQQGDELGAKTPGVERSIKGVCSGWKTGCEPFCRPVCNRKFLNVFTKHTPVCREPNRKIMIQGNTWFAWWYSQGSIGRRLWYRRYWRKQHAPGYWCLTRLNHFTKKKNGSGWAAKFFSTQILSGQIIHLTANRSRGCSTIQWKSGLYLHNDWRSGDDSYIRWMWTCCCLYAVKNLGYCLRIV